MFQEFMQMGGPAAFAITAFCLAPVAIYAIGSVRRTIQRKQQLTHELNLQDRASKAKQIETSPRRGYEE
jgi:heme exporter protein D